MVYAVTLSKSKQGMRWQFIIEWFGLTVQYIYGVGNTVYNALIILTYTSVKKYKPITMKPQRCANKLFTFDRGENSKDCFSLYILNVQREEQKYLMKVNSKLSVYILD